MSEQKPPLWEVMERARDAVIAAQHPFAREEQCLSAEIRALRDWLVPEEEELGFSATDEHIAAWAERQHLRALLTAEADRAERGDQPTSQEH